MMKAMLVVFLLMLAGVCHAQAVEGGGVTRIEAVPFMRVAVRDGFWSPRIERIRRVTLPHSFRQCEQTGRFANFDVAAGRRKGGMSGFFFNDSDVYKLIEGAAYILALERDPELEALCDGVIDSIAAAQEPDGYLYTARTIFDPQRPPPGGKERWSDMAMGHELYCAGHLYEAGVAYFQATGKRTLLDVALRNAELVASVFGPGKNTNPCGHPEIELALVRLADVTGERKYLDLARFFLETRGRADGRRLFGEYAQDHAPILEQKEIVGHAVRAAYLYAGLTDVGLRSGDRAFIDAAARLWDEMVATKLYVTGGIGSRASNEGFGEAFELPNGSAYSETCAAIACAMWSHRLFLATGESRYMDLVERIIYNAFHSGWSLSGDRFFYPNPLASGGRRRAEWFACACCPPNICRFVPSIPGMAYATADREVFVNLYLGGTVSIGAGGDRLLFTQRTDYPWNGRVEIEVERPGMREFDLVLRIPGWARGEPIPGGPYRIVGDTASAPSITVNGETVTPTIDKGYARLSRAWKAGDVVVLELPMPVLRLVADERIAACRGRVALQRGPVVYCFEGVDQGAGDVRSLLLDDGPFHAEAAPDLLGGVTVLRGTARPVSRTLAGGLATGEPIPVTAIPYYAWANRGETSMAVWMATEPGAARPNPAPTIANTAKATASFPTNTAPLSDQLDPASSADQEHGHCHWWPRKGTREWVQYNFARPTMVRGVEVYWFDDTGHGVCRVPAAWRVLAKVDGQWKPVENPSGYGTQRDQYNVCTFAPVRAEGLRLEIESQEGFAGGIHEWRVHGEAEGAVEPAAAGKSGPLVTRWAAQVDPDNPLPEHPRPQMVRESWLSLNGRWQWAEAAPGEEPPIGRDLPGAIVVPFPVESVLSGIGRHVDRMWYRRVVQQVPELPGGRVLLHFGASDWHTQVWVNGVRVGEHRGGYDPFWFDITEALGDRSEHEIVVGVWDPTDSGDQPRGKQVRSPGEIWYTPCSGIWGMVWLEAVPRTWIDSIRLTPDAAAGVVRIDASIRMPDHGAPGGLKRRAVAMVDGREVARDESVMSLKLKIPSPRLWTPDDPFLYDLRLELVDAAGNVLDSVSSYFGLRDVALGKDESGRPALLLNGKPVFMVGPLDQGYWPDGIYTAPTDEALRYDIEITKRLGYNMTRKHVKVEPARWYYWADRLGLLVWQDMPSGTNSSEPSRKQFEKELFRMIDALQVHPSVVMWIVFNEGWGQYDTERITADVKKYDPTRLVSNASGWTDMKAGDVHDIHSYPEPACPPPEPRRAAVLGEFGGLGLASPGHMWKEDYWGYRTLPDAASLTAQYERMLRRTYLLHEESGLAAAVYTQLTDVELECNGLLTYDRAVIKPDLERVAAANRGDFSRVPPEPVAVPVVRDSRAAAQLWRYTTERPGWPDEWTRPDFDDDSWASGPGGFGRPGTPGAVVRTEWTTGEIWLRREAELPDPLPADLRLLVHHDEDAEIYLNGRLAATLSGYTTDYELVAIDPAVLKSLRPGPLHIAVYCRQTRGGQYIDVGLVSIEAPAGR